LEKVSIRLIGDREFAYSIIDSLDLLSNLKWYEYPVYSDKERRIKVEGKVMLYATTYRKQPKKPTMPSLLDFLR
jgi:hypothetical protein